MNPLRRVLILILMPLMAWNASPHLVCRCSTGEIRYFCPKLVQAKSKSQIHSKSTVQPSCCSSSTRQKSCCGADSSCACGNKAANGNAGSCSIRSKNCQCTPVVLASAETVQVKFAELPAPDLNQFYLATLNRAPAQISLSLFAETANEHQLRPDKLIVLTNRWLI